MAGIIKGVSQGSISIGHSPVGHCPEHGFFDLPEVQIEGVGLDFSGIHTSCPTCGRIMRFTPGLYVPNADGYDIVLGPDTPREVLLSLIDIAKRLEKNEITIDQAGETMSALSPSLADYLYPSRWPGEVKSAVIGAVLSAALNLVTSSPSTTVNNFYQTTVVLVETSAKQTPDFEVPIPRPRPPKPSR